MTPEAAKALYDQTSKELKPEEEVRARHILVETEEEAKKAHVRVKGGEDFAKVAVRAHKLKGAAGAFGAKGLASVAARLEQNALAGDHRGNSNLIRELTDGFDSAHVALCELAYIHKLAENAERAAGIAAFGQDAQLQT